MKPIDDAMAETGLFYARFMDDWTRWKLGSLLALLKSRVILACATLTATCIRYVVKVA